ncbi:hypothetical protein [Flagellimonas lutaonensis]|uniref:Uncharacterized protein n=1 Tax=Flagellimonas lutaonensis TaxID=516051 RepID=A0A0D5YVR7_9FLAO|nr:hypothetical protein [Allomuricauda lutaonensis]AKA35948.1 hypothetical protein VC82_2359 [Allomuricauda lutaonensis]
MKQTVLRIFLSVLSSCGFISGIGAQEISFELDYTATYFIPKSQDTITVSVGQDGAFLYTDSDLLAKSFAKELVSFLPAVESASTEVKTLLNLQTNELLFHIRADKNTMVMNFDLLNFANPKSLEKSGGLAHTQTDEKYLFKGKEYPIFKIHPRNDSSDALKIAFDKAFSFDYNKHMPDFLTLVLGEEMTINVPNGVILGAEDKHGNELIRLIDIKSEEKTGRVDLNFILK